jgi:PAS domain S-box-containing protein
MNHSLPYDGISRSEALLAEAEVLASLGSWEHVLGSGVIHPSANLCRMIGSDPATQKLTSEEYWKLVDARDHENIHRIVQKALELREPYEHPARFVLPDGSRRNMIIRGKPIVDAQNRIVKLIGVAMDVTERDIFIEAIRESGERYRDIVQNSNALICTHDLGGRLLSLNELPARILGYKSDQLVGRLIPGMLPANGQALYDEYLERVRRDGQASGLLVLRTRSGERRVWEYQNRLRTEGVAEPIVQGMAHDITERFETEKRLRKSESLLAQAERLADVGGWELELDTRTLRWSEQYFRMLGLEPQTEPVPYGRGIALIHPDDRDRALRDVETLSAGAEEFENEIRFRPADGRERIFHSRAVAVRDKNGRLVAIRGMSQDVTERRREEQQLRKSEALLSQAEQMANCGSWEFDLKNRTEVHSKQLQLMLGHAPGTEWRADQYFERMHPEDLPRAKRAIEEAIAAVKPFEHVSRYISPKGDTRVHYVRGILTAGADGKAESAMGIVQDITDRVRSEEDLHKLLRKLLGLRDEDRRRLARQLHESVGQTLAALTMSMGRLKDSLPANGSPSQALWRSCNQLARQAAQETRQISYSMHPHMLDEAGLGSALRCYVRDFADLSGIDVSVDVPMEFARQPREVETTIFRIVQEALTNVHRHSGSRTARVHLVCEKHQLRAEVKDDGRGLPLAHATIGMAGRIPAGVGITGMRERAEQLNGVFEMESAPGHGTIVRVTLPLVGATQ